jgi:pimeloyl-ACP methyl ester carboxylesterase
VANLDPFRSPQVRAQLIDEYDAVMRTWPVLYDERDVLTSFGSTHVVVTGPESAPPLGLFHGAALTAAMWGSVIAPLSGVYRCYCIDNINDATKSVATKRVRGVADYVAWLRETFAALGIENARVAGLSYGGWLAALCAVHAPELVNRLVLMSPAATLDRIATRWLVRMVSATIVPSRTFVGRALAWAAGGADVTSDPGMAMSVTSMVASRPFRREFVRPTTLTDDELRRIGAPTTVLLGDREVIYAGGPQNALAHAEKLIPNVHARVLPSVGHILTLDAPDVVVAEMLKALA